MESGVRFGVSPRGVRSGALSLTLLAGPGAITSVIISYETSGLIVTILSTANCDWHCDPIIHKFYLQVWETWFYDSNKSIRNFIAAIVVQYVVEE